MLQDLECQSHHTEVFVLDGRFNRTIAPTILGLILRAVKLGYHHIILDFSKVREIDSKGLEALFLWYHNMRPKHVQVSITNPCPYVRTRLDWASLSEIVDVFQLKKELQEQEKAVSFA